MQSCDAFYGAAQVLHGVSIEVAQGEVVSLVGRNGAGKSTVLKTMAGLVRPAAGRRLLAGSDRTQAKPHELSHAGLAYVPEDRRIFGNLTVRENLQLADAARRRGGWTLDRVLALFPQLVPRLDAGGLTLSGGEQQMLAIGRSLLTNPSFLLLDEPTEGLAPLVVRDLVQGIRSIHAEGMAILLVEQNFKVPLAVAQRQYVLDGGRVVWS
ncbi:MAG: ABC transporter ATP-binding protein, partial [Rubrivivax sp.]|nr:ABC transporter ATP-binding protein [Rubrivivax sp.]